MPRLWDDIRISSREDRDNGSVSPALLPYHLNCLCVMIRRGAGCVNQAQVLNLFVKLKQEYDLTYLFISHDIGVIEHISDRVIVMYLGRIVETAPIEAFVEQPNHPYTKGASRRCAGLKLASVIMNRLAARSHLPLTAFRVPFPPAMQAQHRALPDCQTSTD